MCWLDERSTSFLMVLLRELTERKTRPVPHQLMGERATHSHDQERPAHMLQYTLMALASQISDVLLVRPRRLILPEGHVADSTSGLDELFWLGGTGSSVPNLLFAPQEIRKPF